jgi:hypothetical protein
MIEFSDNSVYWILGTVLIALALLMFGRVTSRNLPSKQRKVRIRKYALTGIAIIFFCLPIFKPFVSSYSNVEFLDEVKAENLNSTEDIANFEKKQARTIERLKKEVVELKRDVYQINLYYSTVIQLLSMMIAIGALTYALRKKEEEESEN